VAQDTQLNKSIKRSLHNMFLNVIGTKFTKLNKNNLSRNNIPNGDNEQTTTVFTKHRG